jgi:hypothetical protein
MTRRIWIPLCAAALACSGGGAGGGGPGSATVTAGCDTTIGICIGRTGPAVLVGAEMAICTAPAVPLASCPTAGCLGGCKQVDGELVEVNWFYTSPQWTLQSARATCGAPDVWIACP